MNQKQNLGGEVDEELVTTTFVGNFFLLFLTHYWIENEKQARKLIFVAIQK